ncbi:MAG: hypothetical protein IPO91_03260 [Chloroflexi bacterium]|nr:hypothetical protein [Chloroflexota bacterium]
MTPQILDWLEEVRRSYLSSPGDVLEVGSLNTSGSPRKLFTAPATGKPARAYTGTDVREGPGVDLVVDTLDLLINFWPRQFDTVLCLQTLERDLSFWDTGTMIRITVIR